MRLQGDRGWIQLERSELDGAATSADEDLLLNVTVQVGGYSAADQSWIVSSDWAQFLRDMRAFEVSRRGQVVLAGASPEDLRLEFFTVGSRGHVGLRGHLSWKMPEGYVQRLSFEFGFEPDRLLQVTVELEELGK